MSAAALIKQSIIDRHIIFIKRIIDTSKIQPCPPVLRLGY